MDFLTGELAVVVFIERLGGGGGVGVALYFEVFFACDRRVALFESVSQRCEDDESRVELSRIIKVATLGANGWSHYKPALSAFKTITA